MYVVVTGHNPLQAHVCEEGLARFCTAKYEAPNKSNFKKSYMHLTNYAVNSKSKHFVHARKEVEIDILKHNNSTKRTLSSLYDTLEKQGVNTKLIKKNIAETCSRICAILAPMLEH